MRYFEKKGSSLILRNNGETLMLTPWGEDSIRVRTVVQGKIADNRFALLDPVKASVTVTDKDACCPHTDNRAANVQI